MFNNTLKQLKTIGKESLSLFKSIKDDICLELKVQKELRTYRKELYELAKEQESDATRAHEETQA
jgi:hypothetical protein